MGSRWLVGVATLVGGLAASAVAASAATFSDDYLRGRWTTGSADRCGKPEIEQTLFRGDGTFATERNGEAVAVGFWEIPDDDRLDLRVLASARAMEPAPQDQLGDGYGYLRLKALVFDVEDGGFRMVQSVGDVLQGVNVVRCPDASAAKP